MAEPKDRPRTEAEVELKHLCFLSHDLNNHLGAVDLHLKLLRTRLVRSPDFAEELSALDLAVQAIWQTTDGMRRLLTFERVRRKPPRPHIVPVHLQKLAGNVAASHCATTRLMGMDLVLDVPSEAIVDSDPDLILLVVQNLVGNAIGHGMRGEVGISARRVSPFRQEGWLLSVSDQGPGIPPEDLERIFVAFERGATQGREAWGLGLAIASEAARLLGARLSVESELGAGSTFHLSLHDLPHASPAELGLGGSAVGQA